MSSEAAERLRRYIAEHDLRVEHLNFTQSCHSVAEAAEAVGAAPDDFVKNICLIAPDGRLIVAIIKGEDRVSLANVASAIGLEGKPRLASAVEILERTGYPCGGTPSFGFEAEFFMDERVFEKEAVYTGGGDENALVRADPRELQRANGAIIACLRK
jgi:prolyl-tRNA editing enzyme YbaK/EbsC (Cys-tRNA(Pro) deacylase)